MIRTLESRSDAEFWIKSVSSAAAAAFGSALITETMERRPEIGFASYDRFFPNQDTMPLGGSGNLIALPLQRADSVPESGILSRAGHAAADFRQAPGGLMRRASSAARRPTQGLPRRGD
ncbi:TOTE conflict system archaeo-eukaryotic primase domain-containing protein [Sinorhizobium meliloti]|uniref:TOTE conflict system archaeo-eukaryotic primase domain-containing protein n=1 Tax=Rhizobium meliloti TaxID=382 RepID=UPI003989FA64